MQSVELKKSKYLSLTASLKDGIEVEERELVDESKMDWKPL